VSGHKSFLVLFFKKEPLALLLDVITQAIDDRLQNGDYRRQVIDVVAIAVARAII
jgi:hypothetical protein